MARGSVYEGKTFEEAVRRGLDELGLSRAEATITLVEEGKGGFLGFGARPFRVSIMRRPGGAVREPEEQRERRVSSRRDDRRGGRGGRDRERGRDRDRDRDREGQGGSRRRDEGRRGQQAVRAEGGREEGRREEGRREEGRREESRREQRVEGRREEGRREEGRREGRREERREDRREERREERREDARREERRPAAAQAPVNAEAGGEEGGADQAERRRRRRGRRGGRGRRREGAPGAPADAVESTNGVGAEADDLETVEAFAPQREFETGEPPVEIVDAPVASEEGDEGDEDAYEPVVASEAPAPAPAMQAAPAEAAVAVESRRSREPREPRESREAPAMASGELAETSRKLTEELLKAMGFEAKVTVTAEGNRADVTAEIAKDDDLLTGQKGEVRQALQHLLNRFLNKGDGSRYHLQLEINDFWFRREKELEDLARELADRAVAESTEVVTDYLNSQERRIVHVTLKEDPRVKTYALGTGMIKRVAVAPAGFPERTGEEDAG